jgi:hypothetical protein
MGQNLFPSHPIALIDTDTRELKSLGRPGLYFNRVGDCTCGDVPPMDHECCFLSPDSLGVTKCSESLLVLFSL